jgi:5-guanidino-2-oxopentanoate decarboxylase
MASITGGQAIIQALVDHGVDTVFGIPGVHTVHIYDALMDSPIRHILTRHEQGAGFMADGFARASGRPGICVLITGPGVANAATPLGEAYADSVPVLCISSENASYEAGRGKGLLHELKDQHGMLSWRWAQNWRLLIMGLRYFNCKAG